MIQRVLRSQAKRSNVVFAMFNLGLFLFFIIIGSSSVLFV
jgi:hypothetical protein